MNKSKGIIYVSEFNIEDGSTILQEGMVGYDVVGVELSTWIKPNRAGTAAFLLTFNRELAPESVKISRESHRTKVYEYKQRPMQCKKCQQYEHTINRCRIEFTMCGKCVQLLGIDRGRVDDLSFFEFLSPLCFLSIEFHCTFSISY